MSSCRIGLLHDHHVEDLIHESAISEEILTEAAVTSFDDALSLEIMRFRIRGYGFPYYCLATGTPKYFRVRKDKVRRGEAKYLCPKGSVQMLYHLPSNRREILNGNLPLFITEGEKKLLSFISNHPNPKRMGAVSFSGCWNYGKKGDDGARRLIDDFSLIPLTNRRVVLIPDTDYFYNSNVNKAMSELIRLLLLRGVRLELIDLRVNEFEKLGVDDFIARYGFSSLLSRINQPLYELGDTFEDRGDRQ